MSPYRTTLPVIQNKVFCINCINYDYESSVIIKRENDEKQFLGNVMVCLTSKPVISVSPITGTNEHWINWIDPRLKNKNFDCKDFSPIPKHISLWEKLLRMIGFN